jgi:hypothetical protein
MKFVSKLLLAFILFFSFCASMAFAKSEKEDGHLLVALGDSITFGEHLTSEATTFFRSQIHYPKPDEQSRLFSDR